MSNEQDIKEKRKLASIERIRKSKILEEKLKKLGLLEKDSKLTDLYQDIALEIEAVLITKKKHLTSLNLVEEMKKNINERFADQEVLNEVMELMPSFQGVCKWRKKKDWKKQVWDKCKDTGFFTASKKADVMQALYDKIVEKGDVAAIKLYLTISGDYQEKVDVQKDAVQDIFREINQKLHGK